MRLNKCIHRNGDFNQCVWVVEGVDVKHVEGYIGEI